MWRKQSNSVLVLDEPATGLHPLDVLTLLNVFQHIIKSGATVDVIEHDLELIRNADYIILVVENQQEPSWTVAHLPSWPHRQPAISDL